MEFNWLLPVIAERAEACIQQAVLAEQHGFDALLVSSLPLGMDAWVLAGLLGASTSRIRLLVAQNTGLAHPYAVGKALHSLAVLTKGRADLNIVSGSLGTGWGKHGEDPHAKRYRRTREFIEILRQLQLGPVTYAGEFFELQHAESVVAAAYRQSAQLYVAGSSEEAQDIAGLAGDRYVMYAHSIERVSENFRQAMNAAARRGRTLRCGLFIDIIARPTNAEAWEAAERMLSSHPPARHRLNRLFLQRSDSVGVRSHLALQEMPDHLLHPHVWTGLSLVSDSVSVSIVGSYRHVADTLRRYKEVGASFFIVSGSAGDDEIQRIGDYLLADLKS